MENVSRVTSDVTPFEIKASDKTIQTVKDLFLTQEEFELKLNEEFNLLYTYPQPLDNLEKYYQSEAYISHTDSSKKWSDKIYQQVKKINLQSKFKLISSRTQGKSILDYGCGTGDFLNYMRSKNYQVFGMEPNEQARELAQSKLGHENVTSKDIFEINQKFDVITLWHVLEHIPNLFETIESLKQHLNPNGVIFIAVPNHLSYDAIYYKEFWAAFDVPRHLWHFSPLSIKRIMNHFGMNVVNTTPLIFDAFYVSLLSEKYKGESMKFFKAFQMGLNSNLSAKKDGNFSSLVYEIALKTQ